MKITSLDKTVGDLLKEFLVIPPFQRPYDWEKEHVERFWTDTVVENGDDYFIGSVVLYKQADAFGIVDGQQRITTLLMLLCAVRDAFDSNNLKNLADALQAKLERVDYDNKKRFVLLTETSHPYLQDAILRRGAPELQHVLGGEEERLRDTFGYLSERIREAVAAPSTKSPKKSRVESVLKQIRDRILNLKLITVELDNEDDAYLIFETLNTRGKDLQVSHLLKNHLSRLLRPANKHINTLKIGWSKLHETFEASQIDIDVDQFLHHYWLSRNAKYVAEKKLFSEIKKEITTTPAAKESLDTLVADAVLYRMMIEPGFGTWTREESGIREHLRSLAVFRVRQPFPLVLSILRAYRAKQITKKNAEAMLWAIERFHFAFTAISSKSSSGGLSMMYAGWARSLYVAHTEAQKHAAMRQVLDGLGRRHPSKEDFVAGFKSVRYSDELTKQKRLVQYILRHLADSLAPLGIATDHDKMTIEHVAPQRPSGAAGPSGDDVAKLGNLLWCDSFLQDKLKNKSFAEKKAILKGNPVHGSSEIVTAGKWTAAEIEKRTESLAIFAFAKVWR